MVSTSMPESVRELRSAWRRLRRAPGYATAVVVNLTLGIGAATAIFTVLYGIVLRPLPYPEPDRLVLVQHELPGIPMAGEPTLFGGFQGQVLDYAERCELIEEIGAYSPYEAAIGDERGAESVRAIHVTAGLLRALGARPLHGRLFRDQEPATLQAGRGVVVLDRAAWARRYGADPGVIGQVLRVDGADSELIGVLAEQGPFPSQPMAVWTPRTERQIRTTPQLLIEGLLVRMADGVEADTLRRELDGIIAGLPERLPDEFVRRAVEEGRLRTRVTPLAEVVTGPLAGSLWLLMGAGVLVLLAALANVTGLQLLRREAQRREHAVRRALGAREIDLIRQHLAEAALLAVVSLLAALALTRASIAWLVHSGPGELPRVSELALGLPGGLLAVGLAVAATLWLAAVQGVFRGAAGHALRSSSSGTTGEHARARVRALTAAAEIAVAVILLVGAGLILQSFNALHRVDPGFVPDRVLTFRVPFPALEIQDAGGSVGATALYDRLAERLSGYPGVESVGYASCSPFARTCGLAGLTLLAAERPRESGEEQRVFGVLQTAPGYHETLAIPLLSGRLLQRSDHEQRTNAVAVSAAVAEALWPGERAVGRQIATPDLPGWTPLTVVGVVGEARHGSLRVPAEPVVYLPVLMREQTFELSTVSFVVRTSVPSLSLVDEIRTTMAELRPDIPLADVEILAAALQRSTARLRFAISMLAAAALATLILGATGVYGVIAYAVSLRRGEFGIRLALGASASDLRGLVLRQAATMSAVGMIAGFVIAALGGRLLESTLFGIEPTDPATYLAAAILLGSTALIACYLPARRAAATDPAEVLRAD